MANVIVRVMF
jgi:hypothetical protein